MWGWQSYAAVQSFANQEAAKAAMNHMRWGLQAQVTCPRPPRVPRRLARCHGRDVAARVAWTHRASACDPGKPRGAPPCPALPRPARLCFCGVRARAAARACLPCPPPLLQRGSQQGLESGLTAVREPQYKHSASCARSGPFGCGGKDFSSSYGHVHEGNAVVFM